MLTGTWSLDHAGPLTRSVRDAALVLNALAGFDPEDPDSSGVPSTDFTASLGSPIRGLRLGVPTAYIADDVEPEVLGAFWEAIALLEAAGAVRQDVDLPSGRYASVVSSIIANAEVGAAHRGWFYERPQDYGEDALYMVATGLCLTAEEYLTAQRVRRRLGWEVDTLFRQIDVLVAPTNRTPATPIAGGPAALSDRPNEVGYHLQVVNRLPSLLGLPAISVPCGFTALGLPVGVQVIGRRFDEDTVLRVASLYEASTDWRRRRPPLTLPGQAAAPEYGT
jgi:aspartyl-tRNA(Asn)/glutamyl-tRNA(Gln) amidotransferase subunit A